jgi:triphosphoribosyl-dephospho-CoA synthase
MSSLGTQLAHAFKSACLAEIEALKPGNVHIFADGHGMVVQDFIRSAEAASAVIAQPGITVGQRIFDAVDATWNAVGCNTNLGVILLCAPMIHAAINNPESDFKESLRLVLQNLTLNDAELAFRAILKAVPAGLSEVAQHDVHYPPTVTLLEAMQTAQQRDLVARQYANGFTDIFDIGYTRYIDAMQRWDSPAWAATAAYLAFMSTYIDSHIVRKYGEAAARLVQQQAKAHEQALLSHGNPKACQPILLKFDADLKARGINPGTSADLTAATLLLIALV